ncbi:MAG: lipopolysaccharide biosynthesis protein [Bacteroidetes bacterium]|nr:lipopolysaccharide biosynthesis protein [Bacteroidota bacterium]
MKSFENKQILLITTHFFGYENAMIHQLKKRDAHVLYFDERPSENSFYKGIIRVAPFLLHWKIESYYKSILNQLKNKKIDQFLLIKGEATPEFFLKEFRKQHPETRFIFYAYDSVTEYPKFLKLSHYFDSVFTFEAQDAQKYNWHFRPLFYIDAYQNSILKSKTLYDVAFIGSAHTDRYTVGENILKSLNQLKLKSYFYYFAPGKIFFYLKRLLDPHFKKFDIKKVRFQSLSHEKIADIYQNSFAVLDINKPFQLGLSMRPFEAIASQKKLITTNPEIVHYPFYSADNILVVNRNFIQIDPLFFQTPFKELPEGTLQKISIDSWLDALFIQEQDEYWKWW